MCITNISSDVAMTPKIYRMIKSLEKIEGETAKIDKEIDIGTSIKVGKIYDITVDDFGITAVHIPTNKIFKLYTGPVDKPKLNIINKNFTIELATGGNIPDTYQPISISPQYPFDSIWVKKITVSANNVNTLNGENISIYVDLVHEDGTATRITINIIADGSKTITESDILDNLPDDKGIVGVNIYGVTNLSTTNATVNVNIIGIMV